MDKACGSCWTQWVVFPKGERFFVLMDKIDSVKSLVAAEKYEFALGLKEDIIQFLDYFYGSSQTQEAGSIDDIMAKLDSTGSEEEGEGGVDMLTEDDSAIVQLVNKVVMDAYKKKSSDIHIEPYPGKEGAEIRGRLQRLGIIRESGHEHFTGSVVIPVIDLDGKVTEIYGRKITEGLRPGTPLHTYLPGPHKGVWNEQAFTVSKDIILCESLIDALTFWCADYRNVTASYGVNGFTEDHRQAFRKYGTKKVLIAYDRDEAGERAAHELASELISMGIDCYRVLFPKGMDANEYGCKVVAFSADLGQGDELDPVREKALATGWRVGLFARRLHQAAPLVCA